MLKSTSEVSNSVNYLKRRVCECCIHTLTVLKVVFSWISKQENLLTL